MLLMLLSLLLLLMLWLLLLQLLLALPVLLLLQLLLARASSLRYLPSLLSPLPRRRVSSMPHPPVPRRRVSSMPLMSTVVLGPDEIECYNRERQVSFPAATEDQSVLVVETDSDGCPEKVTRGKFTRRASEMFRASMPCKRRQTDLN